MGHVEKSQRVVVATDSTDNALKQIESYLKDGYQRFKIKNKSSAGLTFYGKSAVIIRILSLWQMRIRPISLKEIDRLKALDEFELDDD